MDETSTKPFLTTRAAVVELASTMSFVLAAMMQMQTSLAKLENIHLMKQLGDEAALLNALKDLGQHTAEGTKFLDIAVPRLFDILSRLGEPDARD